MAHEYGWTVSDILGMEKDQVFACLDAIGNRYGREAAVYESSKPPSDTIDFDQAPQDIKKLQAMGVNVVKG